jgi:phospholipid transport system substrate-binding protein
MPSSIGRRSFLGTLAAIACAFAFGRPSTAEAAAAAPIQRLCDSLIGAMKAGSGSASFQQRYSMLEPIVDAVFNLPAILQVSVGPAWSSLPPDQQQALLSAFRRYTVASYVSNFDSYAGQQFDIQPEPKDLPGGEQLVQTRIVSQSGSTHELDYVMRGEGGSWHVVDVLADGSISRVAVQRSDFRRLLTRGGGPALVDSLDHKTADLSGGAMRGG